MSTTLSHKYAATTSSVLFDKLWCLREAACPTCVSWLKMHQNQLSPSLAYRREIALAWAKALGKGGFVVAAS